MLWIIYFWHILFFLEATQFKPKSEDSVHSKASTRSHLVLISNPGCGKEFVGVILVSRDVYFSVC